MSKDAPGMSTPRDNRIRKLKICPPTQWLDRFFG